MGDECVRSAEGHGFGHRGHRMPQWLNRSPDVRVKRNGERPYIGRCRAHGESQPAGNPLGNRPSPDVSEHVRRGGVTSGNRPGAGYGGYAVTRRTGPGFATVGSARKNQHAYGRFGQAVRRCTGQWLSAARGY